MNSLTPTGFLNIAVVFFLAAVYSFIELLSIFKSARSFSKTNWGWIYVLLNGGLAVLALLFTFKGEINQLFLGFKLLIVGTSALALLRVIIIPQKIGGTGNQAISMIDIVLGHVRTSYDRAISQFDLSDIKPIMAGLNLNKAAETLPNTCSNLLRTITEDEGKRMNEEIQKLLALEEGVKEVKVINLGIIIAKYTGVPLLKSTVEELRDYLTGADDGDGGDIDSLINKFS